MKNGKARPCLIVFPKHITNPGVEKKKRKTNKKFLGNILDKDKRNKNTEKKALIYIYCCEDILILAKSHVQNLKR